jgi:FAD/FMN-containing dehydrogenase
MEDFPPHIEFRAPRQPLVAPGQVECFDRDMTVTVSADVPLGAVQERLGEYNQWLPIDGDPTQTVGQLVGTNSTGPLRLGYGAWRDLLLGAQFLNGRGDLVTAGGRTVKNVAGYDLTKFIVGQRGVFGRLVTLTSRTYRRPAGAIVARFEPDARRVASMIPTPLRPQWAMLRPDALLLGYFGDERTLAYYEQNLGEARPVELKRRSLADDVADRAAAWAARPPTWRAAVPPVRIGELAHDAALRDWAGDAAFGAVRVFDQPVDAERIRGAARAIGGTAWPEDAPVAALYSPAELELLKRLKEAFDPDRRLMPLDL